MEHGSQMVDVLDKTGAVIGQKPRRDIDKAKDIHHTVFILLITPDKQLLLGKIPAREDLPNLYANLYGSTVATIRRGNETAHEAAERSIARELFIDDTDLDLLGEGMEQFDGLRLFISVFVLHSDIPDSYSLTDIKELRPMSRSAIETWIQNEPGRLAPTFQLIWKKYGGQISI